MPSKALIFTYGTRGDVEPFLALAKGLESSGLEVCLATSERFRDFVESHGVQFFPMSDSSLAAIESPDGKTMLEGNSGLFRRIAAGVRLARKSGPINDKLMRETWEAAQEVSPDVIVFHPKSFAAAHVAEKLQTPVLLATLQPMFVPTSAFPVMGMPALGLPGYNRFSYTLVEKSYSTFRKRLNRFRREALDLPAVRSGREVLFPPGAGSIPILHAYSPNVIPRPEDWPDNAHVTGYWQLDNDDRYTPPPELAEFLSQGTPPVFIGFGSMTSVDPKVLGQLVTRALHKAGQRGVIARGWADLNIDSSSDIVAVPPIPYAWLFPRMSAVVHHGGAGTTAEGFRSGVPCVICPFFGDQPGWAKLSVSLGVGAGPVPRKHLSEDRLAAAIEEAVSNTHLRENAKLLAALLHAENGVNNAVKIITASMNQ